MNKRTTKWYRKNESEVMKRLGFKPTRNSGATWIEKADGQSEHCICELKSTDKQSFTIKQEYLHTLEAHAIESHKLPVFAFQFINTGEVWLSIKESDIQAFKELIRASVLEELEKPDCFGDKEEFYDSSFCYECKFYDFCEKVIDKQNDSLYSNGEGGLGVGVEAVSFMPNNEHYSDIEYVNNDCLEEYNNNNINNIDLEKLKQNIKAKKQYMISKQTEHEKEQIRRKEEQRNKQNRSRKQWKRNSNKKE